MNTMTRKQFGRIALAAGLALGMGTVASAQDGYPNKPITMVVPASAGGTTDLAARMTAQALGPVLGQTLVVENKGGGNGNIAAAQVKRAEADGYTLLMQYSGFHVISPHLGKSSWELKDFVPVANVLSAPQIVVVRGDLPVNTMQELVAYAKANPMKTALQATKLAIGAFIVPYAFALSPSMLLIDTTALDVGLIVITSLIGIASVSAAMEGYLIENLNWFRRLLALVGGLMMIYPGTRTDIIGLALSGLVAALCLLDKKKKTALKGEMA